MHILLWILVGIVIFVYILSTLPFIIKTRTNFTKKVVKPGLVIRGALSWVGLWFICLFSLIISPFVGKFRLLRHSLSWYCSWSSFLFGIKVVIKGEENIPKDRPFFLLGNHQSNYDEFVFGRAVPERTCILGKVELSRIPVYAQWWRACGCIFISRKDTKKAIATMGEYRDRILEHGLSPFIFPEGTRNFYKETKQFLLPFKKGFAHIALDTKLPILMVIADPLYDVNGDRVGYGYFDKKVVEIHYTELYDTSHMEKTKENVNFLTRECHKRMLEKIKQIVREKKIKLNVD